jgi:hypothetical protein
LVDNNRDLVPLRRFVRVAVRSCGGRTDLLGGFGVDQGLQHQLHPAADHIETPASADRVEQLGNVRLGSGHRRLLS